MFSILLRKTKFEWNKQEYYFQATQEMGGVTAVISLLDVYLYLLPIHSQISKTCLLIEHSENKIGNICC